jgi:Fe-S-cluster-containing hydrogenase component 2
MCLQACPINNIDMEDNTVEINQPYCIQCLCCVEICPHGAIDLVPGRLLKLYSTIRERFGGGYDQKV